MFPKTGKVFPRGSNGSGTLIDYASTIADALRKEVGDTHQAVKAVMRWTGAEERTIKNWLAGTNGPSRAHLVLLMQHSEEVLNACLHLAGRESAIADRKLAEIRQKMKDFLASID
jgi:hypothetical protein